MSIIHPLSTLIFLIFLTLKCDSQVKGGYNLKPPHNFEFPTSRPSLIHRPQSVQYSDVVNSPILTQSNQYDQVLSDKISRNILQLGQEILTKLESHGKSKTQVFSPVSIASAVALILLGSNGQTYQELKQIFDLNRDNLFGAQSYKFHEEFGYLIEDLIGGTSRQRPQPAWKTRNSPEYEISNTEERSLSNPGDNHIVEIANGVFVQSGFNLRRDYETVVRGVYKCEITQLEFHLNPLVAKNYINNWVDEKTHGKIKTILADEIASDTNIIIASALYFKGWWEKSFFESATRKIDFFPDGYDAPAIQIPMMANGGTFPHYDAKEYGCEILGLPYRGNISTMYIILPYESDARKLRQFQASLTADKIENMISKMTKKTAIMLFPKMHITNSVNMKQIFKELGANTLFQNQCDLSLMSDGTTIPSTYERVSNLIRVPVYPSVNAPLIFTPLVPENQNRSVLSGRTYSGRKKRGVSYKVESSFKRETEPLRLKDFVLNKRITKHNPGKKLIRNRRQINSSPVNNIKNLELLRNSFGLKNLELFVEDIIHKIDLVINETGTEGGAATVAYIRRSGPNVVFRVDRPFMILIRHDLTKLPLFYGTIYEPTNF